MNKSAMCFFCGMCGLISISTHADTLSMSSVIYKNRESNIGVILEYQEELSPLLWQAGIRTISKKGCSTNNVLDFSLSRSFVINNDIFFVMGGGVSDFKPFVEYGPSLKLTPTSSVKFGGRATFFGNHNKNEFFMSFSKML